MINSKISITSVGDVNVFEFVNSYGEYKKRLNKINFLPDISIKKYMKISYTTDNIKELVSAIAELPPVRFIALEDGERYDCDIPTNILDEVLRIGAFSDIFSLTLLLGSYLRIKTTEDFIELYKTTIILFSILDGEYYITPNESAPKIIDGLRRVTTTITQPVLIDTNNTLIGNEEIKPKFSRTDTKKNNRYFSKEK